MRYKENVLEFNTTISAQRFNEYCEHYKLDEDEARESFRKRGYVIKRI